MIWVQTDYWKILYLDWLKWLSYNGLQLFQNPFPAVISTPGHLLERHKDITQRDLNMYWETISDSIAVLRLCEGRS